MQGHFCKVCGQRKSNESFSGKGHANHICKACSRLSPSEQAESMTVNRLMDLPFRRLTENELNWLKNRMKDSREEVRTLAQEIYKQRFPHAERNSQKKQLNIKELEFMVNASVWDEYGDEISVRCRFYLQRSKPLISMQTLDSSAKSVTVELLKGEFNKLLKSLIHYYEIFCWDQDYRSSEGHHVNDDFDLDDQSYQDNLIVEEEASEESDPTWRVSIKYCNDTEQNIKGTHEYLPDKVEELYWNLFEYFYEDEETENCNE